MKTRPAVLVVDCDPVAGKTLVALLGRDGMDAQAAASAASAADALRTQRFDLVLLDLEHIDWSGAFDAIRRADPTVDIIVATAVGEHAVQAIRAGAVDAVAKPYVFDELRLRFAAAADRRLVRGNLATYEGAQVLHAARGRDALIGRLAEVAHQVLDADEIGVLTRADSTQLFEVLKGTSYPEAVLRWLADLVAGDGRGRIGRRHRIARSPPAAWVSPRASRSRS